MYVGSARRGFLVNQRLNVAQLQAGNELQACSISMLDVGRIVKIRGNLTIYPNFDGFESHVGCWPTRP